MDTATTPFNGPRDQFRVIVQTALHPCHAEFAAASCRHRASMRYCLRRSSPMKTQQPIIRHDDDNRVLRFVPRSSATLPHHPTVPSSAAPRRPGNVAEDLSRYEQATEETDDFRHRMLANAAALLFTVALIGIGIWLAFSIADMRKTQDCALTGRRDCARITPSQVSGL